MSFSEISLFLSFSSWETRLDEGTVAAVPQVAGRQQPLKALRGDGREALPHLLHHVHVHHVNHQRLAGGVAGPLLPARNTPE